MDLSQKMSPTSDTVVAHASEWLHSTLTVNYSLELINLLEWFTELRKTPELQVINERYEGWRDGSVV